MAASRDLSPMYLDITVPAIQLDPNDIDGQIRGHGVLMVHFRAMRCPVGMIDPYDGRRPHPDHEGCSNGMIYTRAGLVKALLIADSKEKRRAPEGWLDDGVAQVSVARRYEDSEDSIKLAPADRLTLVDENVLVTQSEIVRSSGTGTDRLMRNAVLVQDLVDSAGLRYKQGTDFEVKGGRLIWTGRTPTQDLLNGQPAIYSIRYLFNPIWYVDHLIHEIRIGRQPMQTGDKVIMMPQCAAVVREHLWKGTKEQDPETLDSTEPGRRADSPEDVGG